MGKKIAWGYECDLPSRHFAVNFCALLYHKYDSRQHKQRIREETIIETNPQIFIHRYHQSHLVAQLSYEPSWLWQEKRTSDLCTQCQYMMAIQSLSFTSLVTFFLFDFQFWQIIILSSYSLPLWVSSPHRAYYRSSNIISTIYHNRPSLAPSQPCPCTFP